MTQSGKNTRFFSLILTSKKTRQKLTLFMKINRGWLLFTRRLLLERMRYTLPCEASIKLDLVGHFRKLDRFLNSVVENTQRDVTYILYIVYRRISLVPTKYIDVRVNSF